MNCQFSRPRQIRTMSIHPTAIIEDGARIHPSVKIGPYCLISGNTIIGEGCVFDSACVVRPGVRIGTNNHFCHGAVIGVDPQHLSMDMSIPTETIIGDNNTFKEYSNIHRGSKPDSPTKIGNHNYFMGNAHAGHDCILGDHNVITHGTVLAGHVTLENFVFVSGLVAIHQFCRIGDYAMVAGCSKIVQDVPPYSTADGNPSTLIGLNTVGLKRAGIAPDVRSEIKAAYKLIFQSGKRTTQAVEELEQSGPGKEVRQIIDFFKSSKRGVTDHR